MMSQLGKKKKVSVYRGIYAENKNEIDQKLPELTHELCDIVENKMNTHRLIIFLHIRKNI